MFNINFFNKETRGGDVNEQMRIHGSGDVVHLRLESPNITSHCGILCFQLSLAVTIKQKAIRSGSLICLPDKTTSYENKLLIWSLCFDKTQMFFLPSVQFLRKLTYL